MSQTKSLLALDVGEVRIGVAVANPSVRIAVSFGVVVVDGTEFEEIAKLVINEDVSTIVVGYPRNQSGEATKQTAYVEAFASQLVDMVDEIVFQDESLTSVIAERRLAAQGGKFTKGDIDAEAASIILQDYLERRT